jgi:hypothetical protein
MSERGPVIAPVAPVAPVARYAPETWVPIAAGLLWLQGVGTSGVVGLLLALVPGCVLLGAGVSMLLWPGDARAPGFAALGTLAGALLAIPAFIVAAPAVVALTGLATLASGWAAGRNALRLQPACDGVEPPRPTLALAGRVAIDDAVLASLVLTVPLPNERDAALFRSELEGVAALWAERGIDEHPDRYHREPPPLESPQLRVRTVRGRRFEHLSFESGYDPDPAEPGRDRALAAETNRRAHAWVLRHPPAGGPRPWLVCVHGYGMGVPAIDFAAFGAGWLHDRLGLNLLFPILPFHGPRSAGRRSGRQFLTADFALSLHAQAQAIWDIRRLISWVRADGASAVGTYGLSMGGHVAALLASLESGLACAIAGIPVADLVRTAWTHGPSLHLRRFEELGLLRRHAELLLRPVSPLALTPRLARERRYLFGGTADRLVYPDQVRDLWLHWERPRLAWYEGTHLGFGSHSEVRTLIRDALAETLLDGQGDIPLPTTRSLFSL